jgi:phosphopantetheinyl transferase
VNTRAWSPSSDEFEFVLNLLNKEEQGQVTSFQYEDDRKRALASRLLQRTCVRLVCKCPDSVVLIMRTKGGKPFTLNQKPETAPNFNFNVSHEVRLAWLAFHDFFSEFVGTA